MALALAGVVRVDALDPSRRVSQYMITAWDSDSGLPQNAVTAIAQSRDGYLWIGTQEGLVRFDGVGFSAFTHQNEPAFAQNYVAAIHEDRSGRLWVGLNGGGVVVREQGRWRGIQSDAGLPNDVVLSLAEDPNGKIWIGTQEGLAVASSTDEVRPWPGNARLPNPVVPALACAADGSLWIGTYGGGVVHAVGDRLEVLDRSDGLPDNVITELFIDRLGALWVGTYGGGLARRDGSGWRVFGHRDGLLNLRIVALGDDLEGSLWVGTYGGGLARIRGESVEVLNERNGLPSPVVMAVREDHEGNLWVGTESSGLIRLQNGKAVPLTKREGLADNLVFAILEDSGGTVWLGTSTGGLHRLRAGAIETLSVAQGLPSAQVVALCEARDGTLLVGTAQGLARVQAGRVERIALPGRVQSPFVWAMLEDRHGALWVGTDGGGLHHRDQRGEWRVLDRASGMPDNFVRALLEDRDGRIWAGTFGGLAEVAGESVRIRTTADGLINNIVLALTEDSTGALWVGTMSGLSRLDRGKPVALSARSGVPEESILRIIEDDIGGLWLTTNRGIIRVGAAAARAWAPGHAPMEVARYDAGDGLPSSECSGGSQPAGWRMRDGRLWFPTIKGVAIIDPRNLPTNTVAPQVHIETVLVDDRALEPATTVELPPGTARVEVRYTANSLTAPRRVQFRYQLEGFDREPISPGTRRTAYYTKLPPGEYRFRVSGCNNDGVWNPKGAVVTIRQRPYLYQTRLFYALCGFALVAMLGAGYVLRVHQLRSRERELVEQVDSRTAELAAANDELRNKQQKLEEANAALQRLSNADPLTAVANRRSFDNVLDLEWRRSIRYQRPLGLLFIDIDHFKLYNDSLGHQSGDDCLRRVSAALRGVLRRPADMIARYGGEEFVILLPETDQAGAVAVGENARRAVEGLHLPHPSSPTAMVVTISVGVTATVPQRGDLVEEMIRRADEALYAAKSAGRNRVNCQ